MFGLGVVRGFDWGVFLMGIGDYEFTAGTFGTFFRIFFDTNAIFLTLTHTGVLQDSNIMCRS